MFVPLSWEVGERPSPRSSDGRIALVRQRQRQSPGALRGLAGGARRGDRPNPQAAVPAGQALTALGQPHPEGLGGAGGDLVAPATELEDGAYAGKPYGL